MRLRKRFVAWLLAGVMVVSSVPFEMSRVQAEEIETEIDATVLETETEESELKSETESTVKEPKTQTGVEETIGSEQESASADVVEEQKNADDSSDVVLSGACGDNVTFVLDSDGVLTISGSGDMTDWGLNSSAPWYQSKSKIKSAIIKNGVTSIGGRAFLLCDNLINVEIPFGVTDIGDRAFAGCSKLSNINIPNEVISIGEGAFYYCIGLKSMEIPISVTSISERVFYHCNGLTSLEIPDSVTSIGEDAFAYCSGLTSVKIPVGVTSIGQNAFFYCSGLTSIEIPVNVTSIGQNAFNFCDNMVSIIILNPNCSIYYNLCTIPLSAIIYGYDNSTAQAYAKKYNRSFVSLGETSEEPKEVFSGKCGDNITFVLDSDGILTISGSGDMDNYDEGDSPWYSDRAKVKAIVITNGVTSIGSWAFMECSNLASVEIPDSMRNIGYWAFDGCENMSAVYISNIERWCGIDFGPEVSNPLAYAHNLYVDKKLVKKLIIPQSVIKIESWAFSGCSSLTDIEIPDSVTHLGEYAFLGCSGLKTVDIPNSVQLIGGGAFLNCSGLTSAKLPNGITDIWADTFMYCSSLISIEIPDSVISISDGVFSNCISLKNIKIFNPSCTIYDDASTIPSSTTIYGYADSTVQGYAEKYNRKFVSLGTAPNAPTEIISGSCGDNVRFVLDSNGVLTISGTGDMENWSNYYDVPWDSYRKDIKSAIVLSGVTSIGNNAFCGCSSMTSVELPTSITSIRDYGFSGCSSLTKMDIPKGVTSIGYSAFNNCSSLTRVEIPLGVTSIGGFGFSGCSSLINIEIPTSVTSIGAFAFDNCSSLTSAKILNPDCSIYDSAYTISQSVVIYGYDNSTAQAYAEKYSRKFVLLNSKTDDIIKSFTFLYDKIKVDFDNTVYITGELVLSEEVDISSDAVKDEVNKIQWLSTNPEIAEVAKCVTISADDKHSLILSVHITAYKEGIVTITGITANGLMDSCKITISKEEAAYYKDDIIDFLTNKGTRNTLHYLCDDSNFTNSIFVYRNDADFSYQMQMLFSDAIYRGKDGWKDLFTGQTSVEDAEKILTAMLDSYRVDCEELSKAKTAHKYANMTVKAFNNFTKGEAILKLLKEDEIRILQGWMSEDYVVEKLLNQEYDKLIVDLVEKNNLSFNNEVNQALYGFMESKELADSLSSGLKVLDKGLNVLSITQDTFNKFYELESLIAADEMYCEMLLCLKENCIYSVVQEAAGNLYDVIQGNMHTIMQDLTAQVAEWAIGKMIDMAVDAACDASPVTKMIKTGFDWGVTWSNNIFHVGDIQQLKDSMRTEAYIGQCLSMWVLHNQTEFLAAADTSEQDTAAKRLYYSLYMLWQTRMNGEKTLQSLMEKLREECSESYTVSMRISKALESFKHSIFTAHRTEALIGTSIACPVDVEVYDKTGNLVLIMKDGEECNGCINGIYYYVVYHPFDEDYVKYLYFGENDGYSLKCVGGNLGLVDCSISGISDEGKVRQKYFENIVVKKDTIISIDNISMNTGKFDVTDPETNQIETDSFETRGSENIAVKKIELSETNCEIEIGKQKLLTFIVFPENAANKKPTWYSDNNNVAVVNSDGVVTAISLGTSVITASIDDISVVCKITVTESKGDDNTDPDNPDKPLIGDVLPEDIPADGKIPDGLWIAGIKDYIYTGMAIKPEVRVYDSDKLLKAGQDYTISYKNNIKANDASKESTTPAVVIKGKGNYTGTEKQTFKILPMDLNDTSVTTEDITVAYNKKMQKKVPVVTYNGKKLVNNKDFTVSYPDKGTNAYKAAGIYNILLTAKQGGNFTGTRTAKFTITNNTLISGATVKKISNQTYTGKAIEPELEVTMKKAPLIKNTDYTVTYVNNIEAGTATIILTGIGEYAGTKKVTFKINGTSLKGAVVSGITDKVYSGTAQEQQITVTLNNKSLTENTDYEVIYSQNTNAGKAAVTIKGIKAYSGTVKKTFKITAYDIKENAGSQIGEMRKEITAKYVKGGSKPKLELTFAGKKLIEGTDYTVSCQNNKTITTADTKNKPTMTIKGKGNFKGSLIKTFTITGKALNDIESPVTLTVADKGFVDKAGKYISVPVLTDADGKKLVAGKDYESAVVYTLEDGTELTKNSKVNAGTKVKVRVTGKGAYTGELEGVYQITQNDFNKAKISISPQTYTGKAVTLNKDSVIIKIGKETLAFGTDYEIVENSYANNIKKGTASVTIVGKGNYGGRKIVKFKITARKLSWFWRLFG